MPAAVRRWHEAMGSLRAALSARADAPIPALPVVPPPPPPGARAAAEQEAEQPQHQRDDRDPPKDVQREPETEQSAIREPASKHQRAKIRRRCRPRSPCFAPARPGSGSDRGSHVPPGGA